MQSNNFPMPFDQIDSDNAWYIHSQGEAKGPYAYRDIEVMLKTHLINQSTLVCN
jgi:hypothetical protein